MTALALLDDTDKLLETTVQGAWLNLPNGGRVVAEAGWQWSGFRLAPIGPAEPIPAGKRVVSTSVEVVDGAPRYVNELVDDVAPVPQSISRRQFYQYLAVTGKIAKGEALAAIKTGAVPAALQAMLDQMTDEDAKFDADCLLSGATDFDRDNPLVMVFAIMEQMSEAEVDDFWRNASQI